MLQKLDVRAKPYMTMIEPLYFETGLCLQESHK